MFPLATFAPGYMLLYWLTLVLHVVLMCFVVAGAGWVAVCSVLRVQGPAAAIGAVFRDWLPFALGAAITAGVAPLLFLQMLHREAYYTANLLLSHRFMAVVPILLIGFYVLYLQKKPTLTARLPLAIQRAVPWVPVLCFVFVAWSFTENHLLSISPDTWVDHYSSGRLFTSEARIWPRLAMWLFGALPVAMCGVSMFMAEEDDSARLLATMSVAGLLAAAGAGLGYFACEPALSRVLANSHFAPYGWLGLGFLLAMAGMWIVVWRRRRIGTNAARLLVALAVAATVCISAVREGVRLEYLRPIREPSWENSSGAWVFVFFAAVNVAIILRLVLAARRELKARGA